MPTASIPSSTGGQRQVPLDVENYPLAPEGLHLEQVHVYIRHGERAPVGLRLNTPAAGLPEHWQFCTIGRDFRTAVSLVQQQAQHELPGQAMATSPSERMSLHVRREVERKDGTSVDGECMLGELTDIGRQSTYNYGVALRRLYVNRLGFLPSLLTNEKSVYFRSTNMPRTIESLQHVIRGLYSPNPLFVPKILVRNGKDENLLGNMFACKRLELLNLAFAQAAADAYNPLLASFDDKLSKYIGGPLRIDGKPRASGILDTIRAAQAHAIKIPPEFEDKFVADLLEKSVVSEWFAGYKTHEFRRLAMGRLLDDLTRKMMSKAEKGDRDELKLLIHSTHDTALAGLCNTLDVFDERWPAFTASITFELFRSTHPPNISPHPQTSTSQRLLSRFSSGFSSVKSNPPGQTHYVRMRYQNRTLILPMCAEDGKHLTGHPELCTLQAFRERAMELMPEDFEKECMPVVRSLPTSVSGGQK